MKRVGRPSAIHFGSKKGGVNSGGTVKKNSLPFDAPGGSEPSRGARQHPHTRPRYPEDPENS